MPKRRNKPAKDIENPKELEVHPTTEDRKALLRKTMREINKDVGVEAAVMGNTVERKAKAPFGVCEIDNFTNGGTVKGNYTVLYGPSGCGKTSLAQTMIAQNQKRGLICAYIDLEHKFDVDRAEAFGVNMEELVWIENLDTAEQAMDAVIKLCDQKVVDIIIVDSVQAMAPKGEQQAKQGKIRSIEDDTMALLARKLGQFLRVCAPKVYKAKASILLIGQVRTQGIGSFVTRQGLSGGQALQHWARMILYMRRGQGADAPTKTVKTGEKNKQGKPKTQEVKIGFDSVTRMEKTQVFGSAQEGQELHLPFYFESGFTKK